jgi:hypothetical protein
MSNEKIMDKLRKLYALSKSSNPHEAAVALQRAQKLMQHHGIDQSDLELSDISESISDYWPVGGSRPPTYMLGLLAIIRDAFAVQSVVLSGISTRVSFCGPQNRAVLASYTFEVLGRQLIKARQNFIKTQNKRLKTTTKTSRGDKFAEGWIIAVLNEIEKLAMTAREEDLTRRWLEKKYTHTEELNGREARNARGAVEARRAGYQEGRQVQLHQPVDGQEQRKIGGAA